MNYLFGLARKGGTVLVVFGADDGLDHREFETIVFA